MKVESLGEDSGNMGNIHQKARDMKKEAEDLLNKAKDGITKVNGEEASRTSCPQPAVDQD